MRFKDLIAAVVIVLSAILSTPVSAQTIEEPADEALVFFMNNVMTAPALYPSKASVSGLDATNVLGGSVSICGELMPGDESNFRTASETNYASSDWESRLSRQSDFFTSPQSLGRVLVVDYALLPNNELGFRYLSNGDIENTLYEPWSSSKIMAFTGAVMTLRKSDMGASATIGNVSLADLITSIHTYEPTRHAPGDSNAIASFLANIAGRDSLTDLFHQDWLKLSNSEVRFRGAYSNRVFVPTKSRWIDGDNELPLTTYHASTDDPGYQPYRCEGCGITGNKPMSLLAQAEWLKRLATHERVAQTRHPFLTTNDVNVLFYGEDGRGGMSAGISHILYRAIAHASGMTSTDSLNSEMLKTKFDAQYSGKWRVFQKIGWGPSETRGMSEVVMLAHVCLPTQNGVREFTLAAQTASSGIDDLDVSRAGLKMQALLDNVLATLL